MTRKMLESHLKANGFCPWEGKGNTIWVKDNIPILVPKTENVNPETIRDVSKAQRAIALRRMT